MNEALTEMKQDGTYTRIYQKWFEEAPPARILEAGGDSESASSESQKFTKPN